MHVSDKKKSKKRLPRKSLGKARYSQGGLFDSNSFKNLKLPKNIEDKIKKASNHAISKNTRSTYATAMNMLEKCRVETNEQLQLPLQERDILIFIGWNLLKNIAVGTIKSYLAGLNKFHIANGFTELNYNTALIKETLEGSKNERIVEREREEEEKDTERIACTPDILKLIKNQIIKSNMDKDEKIVVWAACTTAFHGGFRPGELLCKNETSFNPNFSLLKEDVQFSSCKDYQQSKSTCL